MGLRQTFRVALLVSLVVLLAACDWTQHGFDASRTSYNPGESTLTPTSVKHLTSAWTRPDSNTSDLLVANGNVYVDERTGLDSDDARRAFRVADGSIQFAVTNPPGSQVSAVGNGLVYYWGGDLTVLARDASTGSHRWSTPGRPLVLHDSLMFAATASTVVALTPSGGAQWSTPSTGTVVDAIVADGHLVVMSFIATPGSPGGFVLISTYDETDGTVVRRVAVVPKNADGKVDAPSGFIGGPTLLYLTTPHDVFAVDPATGTVKWHAPGGGVALTPRGLIVTRNSAVIAGGPASVTALDAMTGATLWQANFTGTIDGTAVAGDVVFVGHTSFEPVLGLLVYDLRTGALITSSTEVCCGPIPAAGHVFVAGTQGVEALVPS